MLKQGKKSLGSPILPGIGMVGENHLTPGAKRRLQAWLRHLVTPVTPPCPARGASDATELQGRDSWDPDPGNGKILPGRMKTAKATWKKFRDNPTFVLP